MRRVHILGTGLAGLVAARVLEYTRVPCSLRLYGPVPSLDPRGPDFLWAGANEEFLYRLVTGRGPVRRLVEIGFYNKGGSVPQEDVPSFQSEYRKVVPGQGPPSEGKSVFSAYTGGLGEIVRALSNWAASFLPWEVGEVTKVGIDLSGRPRVSTFSLKGRDDAFDVEVFPGDVVVLALPLPTYARMTGRSMDSYLSVGRKVLETEVLEQYFPISGGVPWSSKEYWYCLGTPFHRATRLSLGFFLTETLRQDILGAVYSADMTPGKFLAVPETNVFQVGRMARGDKSKAGDIVSQALALSRTLWYTQPSWGTDEQPL